MQHDPSVFLKVEHLSKLIPSGNSQITILQDVNLIIQKGESIAIQGTSGCGKTTLLTLLSGLDLPTKGKVYFQGHLLSELDEEQRTLIRGQNMSFVFQSFQLLDTLTALENVMLPLEIRYVKHRIAKVEAIEWLTKVGLGDRFNHYPKKLSGGEQQRVAIARAFISQPKIIFADEMTGNLDTHTGDLVADILFSLNRQQQTTLVLVTHDVSLAKRCQSRYRLHEGVLHSC